MKETMFDRYAKFISENPSFRGYRRFCNICGYRFSRFDTHGVVTRECKCPVCLSMERQRMLYIQLLALYPRLQDKRILHFAPEKCFREFFAGHPNYFDCDIDPKKATHQVDITNISFEDNFFDYIVCVHVLEHIEDDMRAMGELLRVLAPGGTAFLSVPLYPALYEDYSITDPAEREKHFGQKDHVRKYNLETFCSRLEQTGFTIRLDKAENYPPHLREEMLLGGTFVLGGK